MEVLGLLFREARLRLCGDVLRPPWIGEALTIPAADIAYQTRDQRKCAFELHPISKEKRPVRCKGPGPVPTSRRLLPAPAASSGGWRAGPWRPGLVCSRS